MVDPALGLARDIIKIGMKLKKALGTIPANDMECRDLQMIVPILIEILSGLQKLGSMSQSHPAICTTLVCLRGSLDGALERVTKWQKRSKIHRLLTAGDMAKQLCQVHNDIQRKIQFANFAFGASMMEVTIELIRTTTHLRRTQPQLDAAEMEIYSNNSTTGGVGTVEGIDEIITMVTTGTEMSSAPSSSKIAYSGVTEFSLSETVATHHVSGESINGESGYTIVTKETVTTLKIRLHCEGCIDRIKRRICKIKGVKDVVIDASTDLVKVAGTMDTAGLAAYLRDKLCRPVEVVVPGKNAANEYMRPTLQVNAAEGAQQEPDTSSRLPRARTSGSIRAITAKLVRFMRPRPRSSTCQTGAPSSSPLLIEHTPAPTTGPWPPYLFPGESTASSTSMTLRSTGTPQACIHQCQEHARTSTFGAKGGDDLFEKPEPLHLQHQQPLATAPVRHTFNMSKVHRRRVRLPTVRRPRMMPRVTRVEARPFQRSAARALPLLVSCTLCALVLLASVWALR